MKEDYDGAEPSGNSVAALNLLRLAQDYRSRRISKAAGIRTLEAFARARINQAPFAAPQLLVAYEFSAQRAEAGGAGGRRHRRHGA